MIHRYWHGDRPPPAEPWLANLITTLHPNDGLIDWTDQLLPDELVARVDDDVLGDDPRHRANIVRWWLLARHGGTWLDHDVIPLRPLPAGTWTASLARDRTACAVALPAGHLLADAMLQAIADRPRPYGRVVDISGDRLLARVAAGWRNLDRHRLPFDAVGNPVTGAEPWALHLWSTSSRIRLP